MTSGRLTYRDPCGANGLLDSRNELQRQGRQLESECLKVVITMARSRGA